MKYTDIEKMVMAHKTVFSEKTKLALLELIIDALELNDYGIEKNYTQQLKSVYFFFLSFNNSTLLENKKSAIVSNIGALLDSLKDSLSNNNGSNVIAEKKLIGGKLVCVNSNTPATKNNNANFNEKISHLLNVILMDVWCVIEYIESAEISVNFSHEINTVDNK